MCLVLAKKSDSGTAGLRGIRALGAPLAVGGARDVGHHGQAAHALGRQLGRGRLGRGAHHIHNRHRRAGLAQRVRERAPDALAAAWYARTRCSSAAGCKSRGSCTRAVCAHRWLVDG